MDPKFNPAFPQKIDGISGITGNAYAYGLSKREWFAGMALQGLCAFSGSNGLAYGPGELSNRAFELADSMILAGKESA